VMVARSLTCALADMQWKLCTDNFHSEMTRANRSILRAFFFHRQSTGIHTEIFSIGVDGTLQPPRSRL
jgi:hypothetical protein